VKQIDPSIQTPEEAKIGSLRDCFKEIGDLKFATLLFVATCILSAKSCCLYKAADFAPNKAKFATNYARLLRFFATGIGETLQKGVFRAVLLLALASGNPCFLAMDRTDWKNGSKWCNLLVIGLVFRGYLIPLVWVDIGHRGNSDVQTRLDLLNRLADWWPKGEVPLKSFPFLADREFAGEFWLLQIAKLGFTFVMRVKSNRKLTIWANGKIRNNKCKPRVISRYLRRKGLNSMEIVLSDELLCHIVCLPNTGIRDKEPYIYLLTNIEQPDQAGEYYSRRWSIETCFGHLKTNGFDLEAQGFDVEYKLEIIMAVVCLIYTVCAVSGGLQEALAVEEKGLIILKNYKNGRSYRKKSLFRVGLSIAINTLMAINNSILELINELYTCISAFYAKTKIVV
jgi:Transposase DDE domain